MNEWKQAHVGAGSPQVAVRVTDEEKERLEALRVEFGLTSKGQVIRAALDLLEGLALAGDALSLNTEDDRQLTRRGGRRLRRVLGVPRRSDLEAAPADDAVAKRKIQTSYRHVVKRDRLAATPDADVGLSDTAPARGQAQEG